ncbi:1-deoxyxylulose-5-phosphate synthase YajO-like [Mya arenaria]|nr:1-deoxyxylulose-5-phosphate synthase YajO-like [Mya arenaria]
MYKKYCKDLRQSTAMAAPAEVEYNFLGNTGVKVSNLGLGTMTFGSCTDGLFPAFYTNPKQLDEGTSHKVMDRYFELGGNFIDTANIYANGQSESFIGSWMKKKQNREDVVLATKCRWPMYMNKLQNGQGLSRRHIVQSLEDSLARLQTDYVDLYQGHGWDSGTPLEETLTTFEDLVRAGKIRYYGFSNVCGWQLQKIVDTAKHLNLRPCVTLQQEYSLLCRDSEWDAYEVCRNEGVGVLPWSPLKSGMLTGKFKRGETPDSKSSRAGYMSKNATQGQIQWSPWDQVKEREDYWKLIAIMERIAKAKGRSVAQVALRWLTQRDVVSAVIIGCTSVKQLEDNMGASGGWELSPEEMKEMSDACPPKTPSFINALGAGRENKHASMKKL